MWSIISKQCQARPERLHHSEIVESARVTLEWKEHNVTAPIPMFALRKNYVLDENQQPIAIYTAIGDFQQTAHLLSSTANTAHLAKSIEQFKQGNIVKKGLDYEN